jgi:hypothetical protein
MWATLVRDPDWIELRWKFLHPPPPSEAPLAPASTCRAAGLPASFRTPAGPPGQISLICITDAARRTDSAKALAAKAVILIDPGNRAGEIAWPAAGHAS